MYPRNRITKATQERRGAATKVDSKCSGIGSAGRTSSTCSDAYAITFTSITEDGLGREGRNGNKSAC